MMDPRIGILMQEGREVFYAFVNGYDKPEYQGTLEQVEIALGLRSAKAAPKLKTLRTYVVTLMWQGGNQEEITVEAQDSADAIQQGRRWKNDEYGRTHSCNTLPCRFKARLAS